MTRRLNVRAAAVLAALALAATACSSKGGDDKDGTDSSGVKVGPGITDTTIRIGALTDTSGPFAPLGKSVTQGQQLVVEEINAAGGVCGRQLELVVRDHGYDLQRARAAYTEIQPQIAGIVQMIGSAVVTSLQGDLEKDRMLTFPQAWASTLLNKRHIQVVGTTYDIDMVNGVEFLTRTAGLNRGDRVGYIYTDDEYGQNGLAGAKYAADQAGLTIVEQKVRPTDRDMNAVVTSLRSENVKAVLITATPNQVGPIAAVTEALGLKVPMLSSAPGFHPQLMALPAIADALESRFFMTSPGTAVGADVPELRRLVAAYQAKFPGQSVDQGVLSGLTNAKVFAEDLKAACAAKDLTREGITDAHRAQRQMDVGLGATLDFSQLDKSPSYQSFILRVDKNATGYLSVVEAAHETAWARSYPLPKV